ncbi:MAG: hypothetical protein M1609_10600 [Firmicutes bacterium]|nr:hypothetical protein [Bacillota bacterium]MCL5058945.1 hypothetical protein [Actinomycetota bacterium]
MRVARIFLAGAIITAAVAAAVFMGTGFLAGKLGKPVLPVFGQGRAEAVAPGAVLREENSYLCGDVELIFQGPAPGDMMGKNAGQIRQRYPEKEGWSLGVEGGKLVILRKSVDGFCGEHSRYRHLGVHRDRLAVYQGPLGFDQRLLRVEENKRLDQLPQPLQEKLIRAGEYKSLSPEERDSLRSDLEFADENFLNSVLENLDETVE